MITVTARDLLPPERFADDFSAKVPRAALTGHHACNTYFYLPCRKRRYRYAESAAVTQRYADIAALAFRLMVDSRMRVDRFAARKRYEER